MAPNHESELTKAARHVAEGRQIVAEQRKRVAYRKARGLGTTEAENLLEQFERALVLFEADLARFIERADQKPPD